MAHIRWEGKEVELAEDWRVGELIEAENALKLDMNTAKGASQLALVVYISIRRTDAQTPAAILADQVLRMELTALAEDEEADPLADSDAASSADEWNALPTDDPKTSGSQPTATTST